MGQSRGPLLISGALALVFTLAGCGNDRVERLRVEPANPFTGTVKPLEGGVAKTPLGETAEAGLYTVALTTEAPPAVGANRFVARIGQNANATSRDKGHPGLTRPGGRVDTPGSTQPPEAAAASADGPFMVNLALAHSNMEGEGPTVAMKPTGPGTFTGVANIPKDGAWLAQVTVVGSEATSNAFFTVSTDGQMAGVQPRETATSVQRGSGPVQPKPDAVGTWGNGQFGKD